MRRLRRHKERAKTLIIAVLSAGLFFTGAFLLWAASLKTPDLSSFEQRRVEQSTKLYDRTGEVLLYDLHEDIRRTVIPFGEISRHIKNATVAIEDAEFYEHYGIKPTAILRAIWVNITSLGFSQGGSTITQQVVKNSILIQDKTVSRKIKEWVLSLKLERVYSKEKILEVYLNETPYGGNIYGIEEASQTFFGKSSALLSLNEAAYLAALPQAPTYYSPYGNHKDALESRKNLVLLRMLENGFITQKEFASAEHEVVAFRKPENTGIKAPHFVFYVREYLEKKYGKEVVDRGGFKVITTLDYGLQEKAEDIVNRFALENTKTFNASNAALTAVDPKTSQILVMVGSRNYFDKEIDGNFNVAVAPNRQPGSSFKPFVYAQALRKGYTPETIVFDLPTQFSTLCPIDTFNKEGECYAPTNYDSIFRGPITFRNALAQSINVPAVKVLYLAGLPESLRLARDMGIQSLTNANRYGLTLVLGGGEVALLDMTSAYGVFANDGVRNPPTAILRVEDGTGAVLEEFVSAPSQVLETQVARTITDMLADNEARSPAFGDRSFLYFPDYDVAAKTGTTNEYRDAWIVGYTPDIAVGAWAGNNDNTPMEKRVAGFIVAPLWHAFMLEALPTYGTRRFSAPDPVDATSLKPVLRGIWQGGETYTLDTISGKLATQFTPEETRKEHVIQNVHDILYWVDRDNPRGPNPQHPEVSPQFTRWEFSVEQYKKEHGLVEETNIVIPTATDDVHSPELSPKVSITSPGAEGVYSATNLLRVAISAEGSFPISQVDYFINGAFIGSSKQFPFGFSFIPEDLPSIGVENTLGVIVYDSVRNKGVAQQPLRLSL